MHLPDAVPAAPPSVWRRARALVIVTVAWGVLNACLNVKVPAKDVRFAFLLPSPDATAVVLALGVAAWRRWRVPGWLFGAVSALFVVARLFRFADGISKRALFTEFRPYRDASLVPEFARLVQSSYGTLGLVAACVALLCALGLVFVLVRAALRHAERALAERWARRWVVALTAGFALASLWVGNSPATPWRLGLFAQPMSTRLATEVGAWLTIGRDRQRFGTAIARAQAPLRERPFDFARLGGADVQLIFIESYGHSLLRVPSMRARMEPALTRFEADARAAGFHMASGLLTSPIYGGKSWLGHATLLTGTRVDDQVLYDVLLASKATSMGRLFQAAGYRSTLVAPAFHRLFPAYTGFYGYDQLHGNEAFGYRGPSYAWSPMPDQFALEFAGKRVLQNAGGPQFVAAMLVTTHTPWTPQPRYVDDWNALGDGSLYTRQAPLTFDESDSSRVELQRAYVNANEYDLTTLAAYLARHVTRRSLLILLGDHQPRADVTEDDPSWDVMVHVLSQDAALITPFAARGFVAGALPREGSARPMESFLAWFADAYSTKGARAELGERAGSP